MALVGTGGDWPMGGTGWQVLTQGIKEESRQYSSVHIHKFFFIRTSGSKLETGWV